MLPLPSNPPPQPLPTEKSGKRYLARKLLTKPALARRRQYGKKSADEISYLRHLCATDAYFLGYTILGYKRLSPRLHGNLLGWMARTRAEQYRMILEPRFTLRLLVPLL